MNQLGHSLRGLLRRPVFTTVAVGTVALGFSVNALVFSVARAVLVDPLPWPDGSRLVHVSGVRLPSEAGGEGPSPYPMSYLDIRDLAESVSGSVDLVPRTGARSFNLFADGNSENVRGELVGSAYFPMLGLVPVHGRVLDPSEDVEGEHRVVVIGHDLWSRRFGSDPSAVGRTLDLDGRTFEIVGVAPPRFRGLSDEAELWMPISMASALYGPFYLESRQFRWLSAIGRRAREAPLERVDTELRRAAEDLREAFPQTNDRIDVEAIGLTTHMLGDIQPRVLILWGAAGLVLLIATANVSALLLARGVSTSRETAIRSALGADRWSLASVPLTEGLAIAGLGLVLGLVAAIGLIGPAARSAGPLLPGFVEVRIDPAVTIVVVLVACLVSLLAAAIPALIASRVSALAALTHEGRSPGPGRRHRRLFSGLVVSQIAVASALAVSVTLLVRGFQNLMNEDLGFDPAGLVMATVDLKAPRFQPNTAFRSFTRELHDRASALNGVEAAALVGPQRPVGDWNSAEVSVEARTEAGFDPNGLVAITHSVTPGYFDALGIELLRGRDFTNEDTGETQSPLVIVVNRTFADRYLEGRGIGARVKLSRPDQNGPVATVIGVVEDVRDGGPGAEPRPSDLQVYYSVYQILPRLPPLLTLVARAGGGEPLALAPGVRGLTMDWAPDVPLFDVESMPGVIRSQTTTQRFLVILMVAFSVLAGLLSAGGLFGMVSYSVAQQTHDIGVRMAIGASPRHVQWRVVRGAVGLAVLGVASGFALAMAVVGLIEPHLHGVRADRVGLWVGAAVAVLGIAAIAAAVPARRASKVDPAVSLDPA